MYKGRKTRELEALRGQVEAFRAMGPYVDIIESIGKRTLAFLDNEDEPSMAAALGRSMAEYETTARHQVVEGAFRGLTPSQQWEVIQENFPDLNMSPILESERERAARITDVDALAEHAKNAGFLAVNDLLPGRRLSVSLKRARTRASIDLELKKADLPGAFNVLDANTHGNTEGYITDINNAANLRGNIAVIGSVLRGARGYVEIVPALYEASNIGTPSTRPYASDSVAMLPDLATLQLEGRDIFPVAS